jgi:hypothetical protein
MKCFNPSDDITYDDAHKIIRHIIEHGNVIFTPHAKVEMKNGNFTSQDIIEILENGKITNKKFDDKRGNWKYRIDGKDIDGIDGAVITAIISDSEQIIVTVF